MPAREHTDAVRRFNRFYTRRIDVLREGYLGSPFSLAEARLVYDIGAAEGLTATALGRDLGIDLGYLSRLLRGLKRRGVVQSRPAPRDARQALLSLTAKGRRSWAALDARSRSNTSAMLAPLGPKGRDQLIGALRVAENLLNENPPQASAADVRLRGHRPGDMGWVTHRHGVRYFEEYGWDERFEALVARITSDFVKNFDPARERCWIAELDGEAVGSVFVVKQNRSEAKLRLLLIEPRARGLGLGKRLVRECIDFARAAGYRRLGLWTQSNLAAARHIYRQAGFELVKTERHREFGVPLSGEYWALPLGG